MRIDMGAASTDDLADVAAAGDSFRQLWASFNAMPFTPTFAGGPTDVPALDYLDYEGLPYPDGGIAPAALVWGQVLVAQAGFAWVRPSVGGLWIKGPDSDAAVWPLARVVEAKVRGFPQFGKYAELMVRIIDELAGGCWLPDPMLRRLRTLQAAVVIGERAEVEPVAPADGGGM